MADLYDDGIRSAARDSLGESLYRLSGFSTSSMNDHVTAVLDAVAPLVAAKALRDLAEAMDAGWIEHDDLKYRTSDAPKGWTDESVHMAWESMLLWGPYLNWRADEIEAGR